MAETHDLIFNPKKYVTTVKYPRSYEDPPLWEFGCETRETSEPFRIGFGWAFRIPFTRRAVIFGRWIDEGGDEAERLPEALRARTLMEPQPLLAPDVDVGAAVLADSFAAYGDGRLYPQQAQYLFPVEDDDGTA